MSKYIRLELCFYVFTKVVSQLHYMLRHFGKHLMVTETAETRSRAENSNAYMQIESY
jgi:hypothetical protein